jgi:DNA modification methylase
MTTQLINGDCITELKKLPDKSVDLFICDFPYMETHCNWDNEIDLKEFWIQFKRIRKSKRTACIHFCSTKFGYKLIQSNEKMFKMDMVWKKRNKTGGLSSRFRPMRNHEMVYFFYEQAPKYNRDKYHKRINNVKHADSETTNEKKADNTIIKREAQNFKPIQPSSILEEKLHVNIHGLDKSHPTWGQHNSFNPPNPASVVEEFDKYMEEHESVNYKTKSNEIHERTKAYMSGNKNLYEPRLPASVVEELIESVEDEPKSMFESQKCWVGKRNHQTEKPLDILQFFLKYWSCEGDIICDPTMGSGSTGVACKELNRNFIGIELNDEIFKVAENRINNN